LNLSSGRYCNWVMARILYVEQALLLLETEGPFDYRAI